MGRGVRFVVGLRCHGGLCGAGMLRPFPALFGLGRNGFRGLSLGVMRGCWGRWFAFPGRRRSGGGMRRTLTLLVNMGRWGWWRRGFLDASQLAHFLHELLMRLNFSIQLKREKPLQ